MVVQAILGILALEYAWCRTKRFRKAEEARDVGFPAWRRRDVQNWARWKFYPLAILVMPTRLILIMVGLIFHTSFVTLFSIGHDFKKGPMKNGCRKWIITFMYHVCCCFVLFISGMRTKLKYIEMDYSEYLGPDYKKN